MIYLYIPGHSGFGNQLFMYAKAYAEAREWNEQITIINLTTYDDEHPFLLKKLELDPIVCRMYKVDHITSRPRLSLSCRTADFLLRHIPSCDRLVEEGYARKYDGDQSHLSKKNLYIEGYFESWRYFDHYREDIKRQFLSAVPEEHPAVKAVRSVENSVALHIRGGDFVRYGRAIESDYYRRAIDRMRELVDHPVFFVVTLEDAVRQQIREYVGNDVELRIVEAEGEEKDFVEWNVLCCCRHHIIANSTYSWWGAYLSDPDATVLIPDRATYRAAEKAEDEEYSDYYKKEWIPVCSSDREP
ncbi:MAG: alpha-1,2-fucosyltransferase [Lachnospiraceae bacterium]|nr:alpha-1,2-fucosyltransferase [Lachnospiraceae bacterium]